ncbi:DUF5993 family protein [Desulfovibrio inopinatus]|uniref:DUF5993 family protein n=1 Tax=Desulfovibrio inopinatus TaxID=102109 RepID=UPI003CCBF56D
MAFIFVLGLFSIALGWKGRRRQATMVVLLMLVVSAIVFWHHVTSPLTIDL